MRKGEEGLGKIVGERETHENTMFVCICIRMSEGVRVRSMNGERDEKAAWSEKDEQRGWMRRRRACEPRKRSSAAVGGGSGGGGDGGVRGRKRRKSRRRRN